MIRSRFFRIFLLAISGTHSTKWLTHISGLGNGYELGFLSYAEIWSRNQSPGLRIVNMLCIVRSSHRVLIRVWVHTCIRARQCALSHNCHSFQWTNKSVRSNNFAPKKRQNCLLQSDNSIHLLNSFQFDRSRHRILPNFVQIHFCQIFVHFPQLFWYKLTKWLCSMVNRGQVCIIKQNKNVIDLYDGTDVKLFLSRFACQLQVCPCTVRSKIKFLQCLGGGGGPYTERRSLHRE